MTEGEIVYAREAARALRDGELWPRWCELSAEERLSWVQRGLSEQIEDNLPEPEACEVNNG